MKGRNTSTNTQYNYHLLEDKETHAVGRDTSSHGHLGSAITHVISENPGFQDSINIQINYQNILFVRLGC